METSQQNANVDEQEIAKFERMASQWWDPDGQFKPLHLMNPTRANYIDGRAPVAAKELLDIGCGGGLLSEAMAHRGAKVTGIDMGEEPLNVARMHAQKMQLDIAYQTTNAESYASKHPCAFEIVTCLEMLEHVPHPQSIVQACFKLVKPGGSVFFSTINRNPKSYALTVLAAEYILNWVPKGTHEYQKFIRPSELAGWARETGFQLQDVSGIVYNPLRNSFRIDSRDVDCNYIMHLTRPTEV